MPCPAPHDVPRRTKHVQEAPHAPLESYFSKRKRRLRAAATLARRLLM